MNAFTFKPGRWCISALFLVVAILVAETGESLAAQKQPGTSIKKSRTTAKTGTFSSGANRSLKKKTATKQTVKLTRKSGSKARISDRRQETAPLLSHNIEIGIGGRWQQLQQDGFPNSHHVPHLEKTRTLASSVLLAQREAGLSSEAIEESSGDSIYQSELIRALRGDKDSTYRIALMYQHGSNGLPMSAYRAEQWLVMAAEFGNEVASWQLAEIYNKDNRIGDAARYERRAIELGYLPAPRLPSRGRND